MATKICRLCVDIDYNGQRTDPEGLATVMDKLVVTAISTLGSDALDEYGKPEIGELLMKVGRKR